MNPRITTVLVAAVFALSLGSGCIDANFDSPTIIKSPRLIAIRAEPPEIAFGEDVAFEALALDADGSELPGQPGVELRWTVCLSLAEVVSAAGLGFNSGLEDTCDEGGPDLVRLDTEGLPPNAARLPGTALFALLTMLPMGMTMPPMDPGGQTLDPMVTETLTQIIAIVGVPLRVRLEVWRDGEMIQSGFKRFAITQREDPTTNPPPPRFSVGDVWLSARDGADPHRCEPEEGARPVVTAGEDVTLLPSEDEDTWIESYPVYGLDGSMLINDESAYYSWFSTAGTFDDAITQIPNSDVVWTAPDEPGVYPIWLVMRDGHLGLSWCASEVEVTAP